MVQKVHARHLIGTLINLGCYENRKERTSKIKLNCFLLLSLWCIPEFSEDADSIIEFISYHKEEGSMNSPVRIYGSLQNYGCISLLFAVHIQHDLIAELYLY